MIAYTVDGREHPVNLDESDSALGYAGYTFGCGVLRTGQRVCDEQRAG